MAAYGHPSNAAYPPWAPKLGHSFDSHPQKYFPDLTDNNNCVLGKTYEAWMMEDGFSEFYLFDEGSDCCKMWFPANENCPDTSAYVTVAIEEDNPNENYFFPGKYSGIEFIS